MTSFRVGWILVVVVALLLIQLLAQTYSVPPQAAQEAAAEASGSASDTAATIRSAHGVDGSRPVAVPGDPRQSVLP